MFSLSLLVDEIHYLDYGIALNILNGLQRASKALGLQVEDPFVLVFDHTAVCIGEPLLTLKHLIPNSYRQLLLQRSINNQVLRRLLLLQLRIEFIRHFYSDSISGVVYLPCTERLAQPAG